MTQDELMVLAIQKATEHSLSYTLVCAVVEQESGWNPWAIRWEPAFFAKYVVPIPNLSPTEREARAFSWGLMQLMGQVAREHGFANTYLASLCDPATGLDWGCTHLIGRLKTAGGDVHAGLQLWNGGGNPNYADEVMARMKKY